MGGGEEGKPAIGISRLGLPQPTGTTTRPLAGVVLLNRGGLHYSFPSLACGLVNSHLPVTGGLLYTFRSRTGPFVLL